MELCTKSNIDRLASIIEEYYELPAGWDNETKEKTCSKCLDRAREFLYSLNESNILPEESIGSGEEVALFWDKNDLYFIIHFYPDNLRFYFTKGEQSSSSNLLYEEECLKKLVSLIPVAD